MGYRQELVRSFTMLNNLAIGTSVLSFFVLADTYGKYGLAYGGPISVIWGWIICSVFSLVVACCLAELLSAFPTSGGIYYWQVAFTAGLEYSLAEAVAGVVYLQTGGPSGEGLRLSKTALFGVMALMLLVHALLNSVSSALTSYTNVVSFFWHVVATLALCTTMLCTARRLNSVQYVLTTWASDTAGHGIKSPVYTFLMGLLMSQWTIMGYDASIHVVEETIDGETAGSWALVGSVCVCSGLGLVLLLSLTFAMPSMANILNAQNVRGGHGAILQLLWDVFRSRYGNGYGALGMSYIPLVGLFFCANASLCANARMAFAFSRDGAMPGARVWRRLSPRSRLPVKASWLMALLALLLGLPIVYNHLFFATVSAGSVVALSLSYGIPICLRIFHDRHSFLPGPFNLGRAGRPLAVVACFWILLTSVVFVLPTKYPMAPGSANYTAGLIAAVLALAAVLFYAPGFGGKTWFTGPAPNLD
ncbi:hypothetical protein PLESTM_001321800 [Pleodorina starrii]|nr:hypothetical protein PLESTM_001321800 [Pleodorina starrii]